MTETPESTGPTTVLDRLLAAGLPEARARQRLEECAVVVDGVRVSDPATPCPVGESRMTINPQ